MELTLGITIFASGVTGQQVLEVFNSLLDIYQSYTMDKPPFEVKRCWISDVKA